MIGGSGGRGQVDGESPEHRHVLPKESRATEGPVKRSTGDLHGRDLPPSLALPAKLDSPRGVSALADWLRSNGYATPQFLEGWVNPYLRRGWYLTAFRVNGGANASTGPIRMTFRTDRPFNPCSVPEANGGGHARLRVYYVSAGRENPKIGGTDTGEIAGPCDAVLNM